MVKLSILYQRGNDMRTFQDKLEKYASLAVEIGVNVQKGQILFISASIESYEFVKLIKK